MKKDWISSFLFLTLCYISFSSCERKYDEIRESYPELVSTIDYLPDSSFFSAIRCMQYYDDNIYMLDVNRRDIAVLDTTLSKLRIIGRGGRGGDELVFPESFYIYNDSIRVLDQGNKSIRLFSNNGAYIGNREIESLNDLRFFCTDSLYYMPFPSEEGLFYTTPIQDDKLLKSYYGNLFTSENLRRSIVVSGVHLAHFDSYLYAIAEAFPFIEKYDLNDNSLVERIDMSKIGIFYDNLSFISKKQVNGGQYYVLVADTYINNNRLFLLCNTFTPEFKTNKIVEVSLQPKLSIETIYILPGDYYQSFCMSDRFIYAFNSKDCLIEVLNYDL